MKEKYMGLNGSVLLVISHKTYAKKTSTRKKLLKEL